MARQRTTFDKMQRERAKKAKAASKRERRQERAAEGGTGIMTADGSPQDTPADLLDQIAAVHARFEAKQITFEEFEEQKTELFERLAALPIDS